MWQLAVNLCIGVRKKENNAKNNAKNFLPGIAVPRDFLQFLEFEWFRFEKKFNNFFSTSLVQSMPPLRGQGGGDFHIKRTGVPVVPFWG